MGSLTDFVRTKSGAPAEITDERIREAITDNRVELALPVTWMQHADGSYARTGWISIGKLRVVPTDSDDAEVLAAPQFHAANGTVLNSLEVDSAGTVTLADPDAAIPSAWAVGYAYDLYGAAVDIVGDRIAQVAATAYDFKRGDQSFSRSQILAGLARLRRELNRNRASRVVGEVTMLDQARPSC